ncbi:MAG: ribonuclease HII [Bacteroidota bacterium]|nr:ribonuclease HII [Bacteroidota bacterium]
MQKLRTYYKIFKYEAGTDEAGRGCLAGPVFAAAVMLNPEKPLKGLNDSKKLTLEQREYLRKLIEEFAVSWAVVAIEAQEIDRINILQASLKAMNHAVSALKTVPQLVLVDGNRRIPNLGIDQETMVKGDGRFESIAAASILAKTYRDDFMRKIHESFPVYHWNSNKGYPTQHHREAIKKYGTCEYHRSSFTIKEHQVSLF